MSKIKKSKKFKKSKKAQVHKAPVRNWLRYLLLLALLASLAYIASQFFKGTSSSDGGDSLVDSYYAPMPLQLSETANIKQEFRDMANLYNAKEYKKVIPILNSFLAQKPDVKWNLYRGIAYYETGDLVKAEEDFKRLANSPNYYLADHGKWYQALSALKMGDATNAKAILNVLANKPQGEYQAKSKQLLGKL